MSPTTPVDPAMNTTSLVRLLLLSAIWGASFLFMRIGAPVLGPEMLVFARVLLAAIFLLLVSPGFAASLQTRNHWRHYLILGLFNSALPFFLLAHAAQTVSASLLSILNATAPIWAALIGTLWLNERITARALTGMGFGVIGVGVLAGIETLTLPGGGILALATGLAAPLFYGVATLYTRSARSAGPSENAHGSMWAASLWLAPLALFAPPLHGEPPLHVLLAVAALGIVCSGIAYLLYFRLISDVGAVPALTVTFLIPVFGILWGHLFLDEPVGWHTLIGGLMVLTGTALVTGFSPAAAWSRPRSHAA
ncbi:MAG: DMT family transporter [Pseudomonadota bacterium]